MPADDHGLFDLPEEAPQTPDIVEPPITDRQIQQIREAFAAAGIESMDERREIIESVTIRTVSTIREVRAYEAPRILGRIEQRRTYTGPTTGSAWDNREEDTWIDRL